jgi:hypothetical protein
LCATVFVLLELLPASAPAYAQQAAPAATARIEPVDAPPAPPIPQQAARPAGVPQPVPMPTPATAPVLPPAGALPSNITLIVSGNPADGTFLESQIRAALDRQIRPTLRPGSVIHYGSIVPWPLLPLAPGDRATANVSVTIAGDRDTTFVNSVITVSIWNQAVGPIAPTTLFFSDDPEYVPSEGLLFRGTLDSGHATRLYYYHSDLGVPRDLDVVLSAKVPTRIHAISASAGPDLDVMSVGHTVSRNFLLYRQRNQGVVLDLAPNAPLVLRHDLMFQSELVAGSVDLQVLGGGPVTVSVVASPAGGKPQPYLAGPRLPLDGHNRHGMFDLDGFGDLGATYTVGGPDATITYGSQTRSPRNVDPLDAGRNYGGYGVIYRIAFQLVNPTDTNHVVYLYERPRGGAVRSSFLVDGQLKEVGCARLAQPYWFMTYQIGPHSGGEAKLLTMADGGSYYPLEVGVTDQPPVWNTPPVGAVDGCSPSAGAGRS